MKRLILLFVLVLNVFVGFSQQPSIIVSGKITGEEGEALTAATIRDKKGSAGTKTGNTGEFILRIARCPAILRISYIGYQSKEISINDSTLMSAGDTLRIDIALKPKPYQIAEVVVKNKTYQPILERNGVHVVDYEFWENKYMLLVEENFKTGLMLLDENFEEIFKAPFKIKHGSLVRDGFGNIQLMGRDSVYQLYVHEDRILVVASADRKEYDTRLEPFVATIDDRLFFREQDFFGKGLKYYSILRTTGTKQLLKEITDKEARETAMYYYRNAISYYMANSPPENKITLGLWDGKISSLTVPDVEWPRIQVFYDEVAAKPISCPLFKQNDCLLICDHVNNELNRFAANGGLISLNKISYHTLRGFQTVHQDVSTLKIYAEFCFGGKVVLREIDTQSGQLLGEIIIRDRVYPSKIRINDGYIYFLHKKDDMGSFVKLYRQRIEEV